MPKNPEVNVQSRSFRATESETEEGLLKLILTHEREGWKYAGHSAFLETSPAGDTVTFHVVFKA